MALHVSRQVVVAGEGTVADGAPELLVACVFAEVTRQLGRELEPPRAPVPVTDVRLLACVLTEMHLER